MEKSKDYEIQLTLLAFPSEEFPEEYTVEMRVDGNTTLLPNTIFTAMMCDPSFATVIRSCMHAYRRRRSKWYRFKHWLLRSF